ncbi:suppressor of los1-1 [Coemansia sp. Benny D115]|nr:suppressor of los1-1 [Coemansia sp. Benny D115]
MSQNGAGIPLQFSSAPVPNEMSPYMQAVFSNQGAPQQQQQQQQQQPLPSKQGIPINALPPHMLEHVNMRSAMSPLQSPQTPFSLNANSFSGDLSGIPESVGSVRSEFSDLVLSQQNSYFALNSNQAVGSGSAGNDLGSIDRGACSFGAYPSSLHALQIPGASGASHQAHSSHLDFEDASPFTSGSQNAFVGSSDNSSAPYQMAAAAAMMASSSFSLPDTSKALQFSTPNSYGNNINTSGRLSLNDNTLAMSAIASASANTNTDSSRLSFSPQESLLSAPSSSFAAQGGHHGYGRKRNLSKDSNDSISNVPLLERASMEGNYQTGLLDIGSQGSQNSTTTNNINSNSGGVNSTLLAMPLTKVHSFSTGDKVSQALNAYLEHASKEAIARSGRFTVAFSGGSLPATACKYLKDNKNVDFSKWYVFWADERCVEYDSPDSNYKLVKEEFLDKLSSKIPDIQVIPITESLVGDSQAAAKDYQEQLVTVFGDQTKFPVFDCILLGIGPDGHTCSLFPGFPQLQEKEKWVVHIDDSPKPPPSRITLTLPVVNNAHEVAFVVTGAGKRKTIKEIVDDRDESKPASHVAPPKGTVYWFVDDAASQDLSLVKPSDFKL